MSLNFSQVKALLKAYQSSVYGHSTYVSPSIEEDLRQGIDKNQFVSKVGVDINC